MKDLLLSYYGDDFTGSTDVMESLTFAGLRTVLFLEPPDKNTVGALGDVRAVGVAGRARSLSPTEAEAELRPVYQAFAALEPELIHYKTCSTFDSSAEIGSIGRAIDVGYDVFKPSHVPLVVGAPILRRYCAFGNLFASSGLDSDVFRLDRHPTMSRHPTTPMDEADVRLNLAKQTSSTIGLVDVTQLDSAGDRVTELLDGGHEVVLFDTVSDSDLAKVGKVIWDRRRDAPFIVGSSGAEYALVEYFGGEGLIQDREKPEIGPVETIAVASGSCSPVTARQIEWAEQNGFTLVAVDAAKLVGAHSEEEIDRCVGVMCEAVHSQVSVVAHTCRGPDDLRVAETHRALGDQGFNDADARVATAERIGSALGELLKCVVDDTGIKRVATTGGDTSFYAARQMGITALEAQAPLAPGSPLCKVFAPGSSVDGCEVTFKGGQVGTVSFMGEVLGQD